MNFMEYQNLARRTQNPKLSPFERKLHALHGLSSEVGEIHSIFQKYYQGHAIDYSKVVDELGDLMWFACELCDVLNVSLGDVCGRNIAKLRERYPDGFDEEHSLHRTI